MIADGADCACPWCGETLWVAVDPGGAADQTFVSDCEVCCRPIVFRARMDRAGGLRLDASPEGG